MVLVIFYASQFHRFLLPESAQSAQLPPLCLNLKIHACWQVSSLIFQNCVFFIQVSFRAFWDDPPLWWPSKRAHCCKSQWKDYNFAKLCQPSTLCSTSTLLEQLRRCDFPNFIPPLHLHLPKRVQVWQSWHSEWSLRWKCRKRHSQLICKALIFAPFQISAARKSLIMEMIFWLD